MAWQQSDLDSIQAAITTGVRTVRFADGREVQYQSLDHLIAAQRVISNALALQSQAQQGFVRRKFGAFRSGF